ncbi:MAG: hypothetical protein BWY67_00794 [Bacteroidetes bacterium ADurb.Bin397]|nr:MAG: hypothetical protein BWY67_00794 [Bacteroidetes bacterium ADurb.Bin397]
MFAVFKNDKHEKDNQLPDSADSDWIGCIKCDGYQIATAN